MKAIHAAVIVLSVQLLAVPGFAAPGEEVIQCTRSATLARYLGGPELDREDASRLCKGSTNGEAVVDCFQKANRATYTGGLDLPKEDAIRLCRKATDSEEVRSCFQKANRANYTGGLDLPKVDAIELCGQATDSDTTTACYEKATLSSSRGGWNLGKREAIEACKVESNSNSGSEAPEDCLSDVIQAAQNKLAQMSRSYVPPYKPAPTATFQRKSSAGNFVFIAKSSDNLPSFEVVTQPNCEIISISAKR